MTTKRKLELTALIFLFSCLTYAMTFFVVESFAMLLSFGGNSFGRTLSHAVWPLTLVINLCIALLFKRKHPQMSLVYFFLITLLPPIVWIPVAWLLLYLV